MCAIRLIIVYSVGDLLCKYSKTLTLTDLSREIVQNEPKMSQENGTACDFRVLRTSRTVSLKCNIKPEPYLALIIPKHRQALAKFRCSSHHLAIETGRHQKPKLPVEKRLCSECNVLEDEMHHLINCSKNEIHRKTLFNVACSKIDNFNNLDSTSKFQELLMCKDLKIRKEIAVFLLINSAQ